MAFQAQVRLADVPSLRADTDALVSFHYCLACAPAGEMSFGRNDTEHRGYEVTLFLDAAGQPDGVGTKASGGLPALKVGYSDVDEIPSLEDLWALRVVVPAGLFESVMDDFDENVGEGFVHVARSKVGGWPHWQQSPEWPMCSEARRMTFVMQLDFDLGEEAPWAAGGYAYLFACGSECSRREADMVLQTT